MNVYQQARDAVREGRVSPECPECRGRGWIDLTPDAPAWESLPALCKCSQEIKGSESGTGA